MCDINDKEGLSGQVPIGNAHISEFRDAASSDEAWTFIIFLFHHISNRLVQFLTHTSRLVKWSLHRWREKRVAQRQGRIWEEDRLQLVFFEHQFRIGKKVEYPKTMVDDLLIEYDRWKPR